MDWLALATLPVNLTTYATHFRWFLVWVLATVITRNHGLPFTQALYSNCAATTLTLPRFTTMDWTWPLDARLVARRTPAFSILLNVAFTGSMRTPHYCSSMTRQPAWDLRLYLDTYVCRLPLQVPLRFCGYQFRLPHARLPLLVGYRRCLWVLLPGLTCSRVLPLVGYAGSRWPCLDTHSYPRFSWVSSRRDVVYHHRGVQPTTDR